MPDHVHLLLTSLRDEAGWPYGLPAILKLIKGASARSINKLLGSGGPVWQEESFDHVLRSQESLAEKLEYIRQNPVRRGLVKRETGRLSLALCRARPQMRQAPCGCKPVWVVLCGSDTLVRRFWFWFWCCSCRCFCSCFKTVAEKSAA